MKQNTKRREVAKILVEDRFFEKGHRKTKIIQSLVALIGWVGILVPLIWTSSPFLLPRHLTKRYHLMNGGEISSIRLLFIFLAFTFLTIVIIYITLTLFNNHRFNRTLRYKNTHNEAQLNKRRFLMNQVYSERFGSEDFRLNVRYYSVSEEQNFDTSFIKNLYDDGGAKL